jgi:hypothetical protein
MSATRQRSDPLLSSIAPCPICLRCRPLVLYYCSRLATSLSPTTMQALRQPALQQRTLGSRSGGLYSYVLFTGLRQARQAAALSPNPAARPAPLPVQQLQQQQQHRCSHIARITPFDQAWGTQIDGQVRHHVLLHQPEAHPMMSSCSCMLLLQPYARYRACIRPVSMCYWTLRD